MTNKQGQGTDPKQHDDSENEEGRDLPLPVEPAKTIKESVDQAGVDPEDIARKVPYEDSGDSEAGLLDDGI